MIHDASLLKHLRGYAAGAFLPDIAARFALDDPSTGSELARLPSYGHPSSVHAIEAAEGALASPTTRAKRSTWLAQIAAAHAVHREQLAQIISLENGKPVAEARGEVDYSAGFFAEAARRIECLAPRRLAERPRNHQWTVFARPAGVAGLIVPWNFPLAMLAKKASAALAAGAPVVVKPSEKTPLSAIALFHIFHQLQLPPGMVNLVFGDAPAIGRTICEHSAVRVISFTGSTDVGKLLSTQAAPHVKRMALELGGNAPFIVFDDADLQRAADELMSNKFRCSGQTCVCANRVMVQSGVADEFVRRVAARVAALKVGPGRGEGTQVGPLIDQAGVSKVRALVQEAQQQGARVVVGAEPSSTSFGSGHFYPPTVLDQVPANARCLREELFGPVVTVIRFSLEAEAVRLANDTAYGLAAYVFTQDLEKAERVTERLSFGHVALNSGTGPTPEAPFGGMKQSGLGREGGDEGIFEYVELQTVASKL